MHLTCFLSSPFLCVIIYTMKIQPQWLGRSAWKSYRVVSHFKWGLWVELWSVLQLQNDLNSGSFCSTLHGHPKFNTIFQPLTIRFNYYHFYKCMWYFKSLSWRENYLIEEKATNKGYQHSGWMCQSSWCSHEKAAIPVGDRNVPS